MESYIYRIVNLVWQSNPFSHFMVLTLIIKSFTTSLFYIYIYIYIYINGHAC